MNDRRRNGMSVARHLRMMQLTARIFAMLLIALAFGTTAVAAVPCEIACPHAATLRVAVTDASETSRPRRTAREPVRSQGTIACTEVTPVRFGAVATLSPSASTPRVLRI